MVLSRRAALLAAGIVAALPAAGGAQNGGATADARIVPGERIGPVRLGMSRAAALKAVGSKPASSAASGGYREDSFRWAPAGGRPPADATLGVISRGGRVVQVWASHPACRTSAGLGTGSTFAAVRKAMPRLSVRDYAMIEEGGGGYVLLLFDDVRGGVAFTTGTQDDQGTYEALPTLKPGSVVVHPAGARALPFEYGLLGRPGKPFPGSHLPRVQSYMNGGPHKPGR